MPRGRGGQALDRSRSWGSNGLKSQGLTSWVGTTRCRKMDLFQGAMGYTLELSRGWSEMKGQAATVGSGHRGPSHPTSDLLNA